MTYTCGCVANTEGFGRGKARLERLAKHLARPCEDCLRATILANYIPVRFGTGAGDFYSAQQWAERAVQRRPDFRI